VTVAANTVDFPYPMAGAWSETALSPDYYANFWFLWTPSRTATEVITFSDNGLLQIFNNYPDARTGNNAAYDAYVGDGEARPWAVVQGAPIYLHYQFTGSGDFTISATGAPPAFWGSFQQTKELP
jgi:hypothetical protein